MKRFISALLIVLVLLVSILGIGVYYAMNSPSRTPTPTPTPSPPPTPTVTPTPGTYLPRKDGSESSLFLVNSSLYYGVYEQSFWRMPKEMFSVKEGDPCIIINGTIRNDYDQDYYHRIGAKVLNAHGEEVEPILSWSAPSSGYTVVFAKKDEMGVFDLHIPYNATDITEYELLVMYEPTEIPPP